MKRLDSLMINAGCKKWAANKVGVGETRESIQLQSKDTKNAFSVESLDSRRTCPISAEQKPVSFLNKTDSDTFKSFILMFLFPTSIY